MVNISYQVGLAPWRSKSNSFKYSDNSVISGLTSSKAATSLLKVSIRVVNSSLLILEPESTKFIPLPSTRVTLFPYRLAYKEYVVGLSALSTK